ncbi:hypothetical protein COV25_00400 [candidate division WWE3 bacterium CG10_big_fil_rev_8_21_14_0_10_35_32]|nr:MAG: hypothetical protein COV25_00400 [candidate division WWE3 bacterium CG10_big_fil_rev_8_21_14_0_10_35_32]
MSYVFVRIFLINVNFTEWGDTFRMIRGASYLSSGSWPFDEKRLPFYSLLLVPGIWLNAEVLWGRLLSLVSSSVTLLFVYLFYLKFISTNKKFALLSVITLSVTSVFAYWGFRVMADPIFTMLIISFIYFFMFFYTSSKGKSSLTFKQAGILSFILLTVTMTRIEGAFLAFGVGFFFLFNKKWRDAFIFFVPQSLIHVPWMIYTKFIYSGNIQNDYFEELRGFIFDIKRFEYFFSYTTFVLVVPCLIVFLLFGISYWKKNKLFGSSLWMPLLTFLLLEIAIGFIWTPSLPRIYMPIIPFVVMLSVFGIEKIDLSKHKILFVALNLVSLGLFIYLQSSQKLYFLGASKLLFISIIGFSILISVSAFFSKYFHRIIFSSIIISSTLISGIVIYNQKDVYKTVKQGIDFIIADPGFTAYSDETGNTEWYLKDNSVYLPQNIQMNGEVQYRVLKKWDAKYLLWTNEFNRGSTFVDPKADPRYTLLAVFKQEIKDPFDVLLNSLRIVNDENAQVFYTKVYLVN